MLFDCVLLFWTAEEEDDVYISSISSYWFWLCGRLRLINQYTDILWHSVDREYQYTFIGLEWCLLLNTRDTERKTPYCPRDSTFSCVLSGHQRSVDEAALGEISVAPSLPLLNHVWGKWFAGLEKNVGCRAGEIIPKKIKKPEITKTLNISSGGDSQQREKRRRGRVG